MSTLPQVFNLPAGHPFAPEVARLMWDLADHTPTALQEMLVLLPTRRASRALGRALVEQAPRTSEARALILPQLHTLGDLEPDVPPLAPQALEQGLRPAASVWQRLLVLAQLVRRWYAAQDTDLRADQAMALAGDLARLLEACHFASIEPAQSFADLVTDHMAAHWQHSATFLDIVAKAWPAWLDEQNLMDPSARQMALIRRLAEILAETPPSSPVIMAGSTAALPAVAEVMATVAHLPQGYVILPGLDQDMDSEAWDAVDPGHPQWTLKMALARLGLPPQDVPTLPATRDSARQLARRRLLSASLTPADATTDWPRRIAELRQGDGSDPFHLGLEGLQWIEAEHDFEAARMIALCLQDACAEGAERAVLVCPDLTLSQRVSAELNRKGLAHHTSFGVPLSDCDFGQLLALSAATLEDITAPHRLLALLKHPALGLDPDALYALDHDLRGPKRDALPPLPGALAAHLQRLLHLGTQPEPQALTDWLEGHLHALEALCADGAASLWRVTGAAEVADLLTDLLTHGALMGPISKSDYVRVLPELLRRQTAPTPPPDTPCAIELLGALEARLVDADRVVLAGLEDGVWPHMVEPEVLMSRSLRAQLGLPPLEARIGLSAHDFFQAACSPQVVLVKRKTLDGKPALASRWVWRLETVMRGANVPRPTVQTYHHWSALEHQPHQRLPAPRPAPCPPVAARPRSVSVTTFETWVRDPYAVYAKSVLKLRPLKPLGGAPGYAERGTAWHRALESLRHQDGHLPTPETMMTAFTKALQDVGFSQEHAAREQERFAPVIAALLALEATRSQPRTTHVEIDGRLTVEIENYGPVTLRGQADRIDVTPKGAEIIDYKTGTPPSQNQIKGGFAAQLPLLGWILQSDGFPGIAAQYILDLTYIKLGSAREPLLMRNCAGELGTPAGAAGAFKAFMAQVAEPSTPFLSRKAPKFCRDGGDYDQLARVQEWQRLEPEESGYGD